MLPPETPPERRRQQDRIEASILIRTIAGEKLGDTVKAQITRACLRLGWGFNRCEEIWRRRAHRIEAWEMDTLRTFVHRGDDWENSP